METVPRKEISKRIRNFQTELAANDLEGAFILQNADRFYFTGTIQSAVLFIPSGSDAILMVQKNLERAQVESALDTVIQVKNKNHIPQVLNDFRVNQLSTAGLEMDVLPANLYIGFQKKFPKCRWMDISGIIRKLRMIKSGYGDFFMGHGEGQVPFIGHGIGLEIDEYPIISPRFDAILEEGMVFALEPMFVLPKQGVVGLEDDYLVTPEGLKRLTLTEQSLIQI